MSVDEQGSSVREVSLEGAVAEPYYEHLEAVVVEPDVRALAVEL